MRTKPTNKKASHVAKVRATKAVKPPTPASRKKLKMETLQAVENIASKPLPRKLKRKPPTTVAGSRPMKPLIMGVCEPCGHSWPLRNPSLSRCPACNARTGLTIKAVAA
jgi:rubrerythrin